MFRFFKSYRKDLYPIINWNNLSTSRKSLKPTSPLQILLFFIFSLSYGPLKKKIFFSDILVWRNFCQDFQFFDFFFEKNSIFQISIFIFLRCCFSIIVDFWWLLSSKFRIFHLRNFFIFFSSNLIRVMNSRCCNFELLASSRRIILILISGKVKQQEKNWIFSHFCHCTFWKKFSQHLFWWFSVIFACIKITTHLALYFFSVHYRSAPSFLHRYLVLTCISSAFALLGLSQKNDEVIHGSIWH